MIGRDLPNTDHVVRYVRPSLIRSDGSIRSAAFRLRKNEVGLSVHWLEYWSNAGFGDAMAEIRPRSRLSLSRNGRYAELNVGRSLTVIAKVWIAARCVNAPLGASKTDVADPSHSEITPLPAYEDAMSIVVATAVASFVATTHPAVV